MGRRATGLLIALVIGVGCSGEQAYSPRPPDGGLGLGGVGGIAGTAGDGGMGGSAGSAGSIATAGTGGDAGVGGSAGAAGTAGGGGTTVVAGSAGVSGSAGMPGAAGATGSGGRGGTGGSGGTAGSAGSGAGGTAGAGGAAGRGGAGGTAGAGGAAGRGGAGGTAGTGGFTGGGGIRDGGSGPYACPAVIYGSLDNTDLVQYGRENRTLAPGACGANKTFPGDDADPMDAGGVPGNPHYYDVYHFTNPGTGPACLTFTLDYDGMNTFIQRYITVYTTYDPTNIRSNYLSDAGSVLNPPQTMAITVPASSSIDVVVFSINVAGSSGGVGVYTLSCSTGSDGGM
jgi:hypothetical protein